MSHTLWVCPVTTSSMSPTPGTMGNTTGAVPWWTSTRPSRCRQGPCPTTTGLPSRSAKTAGFYITLMQMEIAVSCSLALKCTWIDVLKSKAVYSVCTIHSDHLALLRAQQLLLVRLQKMALEQKDFRKKVGGLLFLKHMSVSVKGYCCTFPLSLQFLKKPSARVRLVKAVDPSCRGIGSLQAVVYTLSKRKFLALTQTHNLYNKMTNSPDCPCLAVPQGHEEHLIPYSMVQPVYVQTKRPVIFSPSILSRGLIERLLQPAESGLMFDTCSPGTCTAITLY